MYRKTHSTSPYFRMPSPHDPVTTNYAPLSMCAPYCRFVLLEDLTTEMDRAAAQITHQWGPGPRHSFSDTIKVFNFCLEEEDEEAGTDAVYKFSGGVDAAGIAVWDQGQKWIIVEMNGAGTIGGCLAENHPGRGEEFDIHLGTWDAGAQKWIYDTENTVTAIDWRYGVPYPESGSTGLFEARASTSHGTIYETVALDCEPPPEGCDEEE